MASASASASATATASVAYTLLWCYSYEPGFDTAYTLLDVVLYEENEAAETLDQVLEYLANEEALDGLEEQHKIIFSHRHFTLPGRVSKLNFLMAALYPAIEDAENIIDLVLYPLETDWNDLDEELGRAPVLHTVLTEAETAQDFAYKVVDACNFVVRVAAAVTQGESDQEEEEDEEV
jgi:hypothetical protein